MAVSEARFLVAFLGLLHFSASEPCPTIYQRFSSQHTFCRKPNAADNQILEHGVSEEDRKIILDSHNNFKRSVALGNRVDSGLEPAANMYKLEYDFELEQIAQKHADLCDFEHDCNKCRQTLQFTVGQNVHQVRTDKVPTKIEPNWKKAIQSFTEDELQFFLAEDLKNYTGKSVKAGHLIQVIWAKTQRVGCGYSLSSRCDHTDEHRYQLYTCVYGPSGNVIGQPIYEIGDACSKCPSDTDCDNGLCSLGLRLPSPIKPKNATFYCTFRGDNICKVEHSDYWHVVHTHTGSYLEAVLNKGETGILVFEERIPVPKGGESICVKLRYRKGPNKAEDAAANNATVFFNFPEPNFNFSLDTNDVVFRELRITVSVSSNKATYFKLSIFFSVPYDSRAKPQFMNFLDMAVFKHRC